MREARIAQLSLQKSYGGTTTKNNIGRIRRAVNLLLMSAEEKLIWNPIVSKHLPHKLSFVTLTVSSNDVMLSAKEAYKLLLKPWLQSMRRNEGMKTYVWKAELQKRGQIHYHITTPSWINLTVIRKRWNELQQKAGLLEGYYQKRKHYNPNSTDVHAVYKVNDVEAYLVKYLAKAESDKAATDGKIWDCSVNLKGVKYPTFNVYDLHVQRVEDAIVAEKMEVFECDYAQIIRCKSEKPWLYLQYVERCLYDGMLFDIREGKRVKHAKQKERTGSPADSYQQIAFPFNN